MLLSLCHLASIPLMAGFAVRDTQQCGTEAAGMRAVLSAAVFTTGLFLSIAAVGAICSMLGYMLGTVPLWIALFVGLLFVWLGLQTAGIVKVAIPAVLPERFALKGLFGAFVLGAGYGLLSGPCTFGSWPRFLQWRHCRAVLRPASFCCCVLPSGTVFPLRRRAARRRSAVPGWKIAGRQRRSKLGVRLQVF